MVNEISCLKENWGLVPSAICRCGAELGLGAFGDLQMRSRNGSWCLGELQMRSRGAIGQSHTSFLSPVPPSKWDTWFGDSWW